MDVITRNIKRNIGTEAAWEDFITKVHGLSKEEMKEKYIRLNPSVPNPPRIDSVRKLDSMENGGT